MNGTLVTLVVIAAVLTLGVLFTGLISMARGGEFNLKYGNRLMQLRVAVQAVALVLFVVAMLIAKG
jgi:hypothetical protein|tara:strand:+ start:1522 stop:1719 length:198 start_codon:yes stop_codon:yes gene_type:complete